jgi:hypothetical protein
MANRRHDEAIAGCVVRFYVMAQCKLAGNKGAGILRIFCFDLSREYAL